MNSFVPIVILFTYLIDLTATQYTIAGDANIPNRMTTFFLTNVSVEQQIYVADFDETLTSVAYTNIGNGTLYWFGFDWMSAQSYDTSAWDQLLELAFLTGDSVIHVLVDPSYVESDNILENVVTVAKQIDPVIGPVLLNSWTDIIFKMNKSVSFQRLLIPSMSGKF